MPDDKTYLVIGLDYSRYSEGEIGDWEAYYDSSLPGEFTLQTVSKDNIFPFYVRRHASRFAVELPAGVKTNNEGEIVYLKIEPTYGSVRQISEKDAIGALEWKYLVHEIPTSKNRTNGKIWIKKGGFGTYSAIVALPIPSKELTRSYLSQMF